MSSRMSSSGKLTHHISHEKTMQIDTKKGGSQNEPPLTVCKHVAQNQLQILV
jgi:hypothetical protein